MENIKGTFVCLALRPAGIKTCEKKKVTSGKYISQVSRRRYQNAGIKTRVSKLVKRKSHLGGNIFLANINEASWITDGRCGSSVSATLYEKIRRQLLSSQIHFAIEANTFFQFRQIHLREFCECNLIWKDKKATSFLKNKTKSKSQNKWKCLWEQPFMKR